MADGRHAAAGGHAAFLPSLALDGPQDRAGAAAAGAPYRLSVPAAWRAGDGDRDSLSGNSGAGGRAASLDGGRDRADDAGRDDAGDARPHRQSADGGSRDSRDLSSGDRLGDRALSGRADAGCHDGALRGLRRHLDRRLWLVLAALWALSDDPAPGPLKLGALERKTEQHHAAPSPESAIGAWLSIPACQQSALSCLALLRTKLFQPLAIERREIDIVEHQRRVAAIPRHIRDHPPRIGQDLARAFDEEEGVNVLLRHIGDLEQTDIVEFDDEARRLAGFRRRIHLHRQLIAILARATCIEVHVDIDLGRALDAGALLGGDVLEGKIADEMRENPQTGRLLLPRLASCRLRLGSRCAIRSEEHTS